MVAGSGTFGKETRFDRDKLMSQNGAHSPWGRAYLQRSRFWRGKDEAGPIAGMGVGPRPINIQGTGLPNVGPGSYTPVTSTAKTTSALDGPKYCKMTIKTRNKVIVGAVSPHEEARKPGPGTYVLPDEISQGGIKIGLPLREVSGEGKLCDALYDVSPGLGSKVSPDLKSTFGLAARWEEEDTTTSQSPKGDLYYSHCKLTEDYTAHARASSLGVGPRPMLVYVMWLF